MIQCFPSSVSHLVSPFQGFLEDCVVVVFLPLSFAFEDRGQQSPTVPWRGPVVSVRRGTSSCFDEGEGHRVAVIFMPLHHHGHCFKGSTAVQRRIC